MTDPVRVPHRRHRRRSPLRRLRGWLGLDHGRGRVVTLAVAAVIAVVAVVAAAAGFGAVPPEPAPSYAAIASGLGSSTLEPTPTPTLPPVRTDPPVVTPSPSPEGIVASRIRVTRLGIDLPVVIGDGVDAPLNKAAHYPGTGWPGGGTNIYLYAHARTQMFLALWDAKVGDEVDLDLVDGTTRKYIVSSIPGQVAWNAMSWGGGVRA